MFSVMNKKIPPEGTIVPSEYACWTCLICGQSFSCPVDFEAHKKREHIISQKKRPRENKNVF